MKRLILAIISVVMIILGCTILAYSQEVDIELTKNDNQINVIEEIPAEFISKNTLEFWIQNGATDIKITAQDETYPYESVENNIYIGNLTDLNTDISVIKISYKLNKDITEFEKKILYNLTSIIMKYNNIEIFSGNNLKKDNIIKINLPEEQEEKIIENNIEKTPAWIYIIIVILLIFIIVLFFALTKKQSISKKPDSISGSEELLSTKKNLLMSILKDIEKQHRAKKITDETYNKLKEYYKNEAVITMKKLEDAISKVK